jgi:hypothetical protein
MLVEAEIAAVGEPVLVTVAVVVAVHPLASVMVTVYVPESNPVAVDPVPPEGVHE